MKQFDIACFGSYKLFGLAPQEYTPCVRLCHVWATPSHLAASATYVACVTPSLLAFPTPCCVSCRPAVTILQQQLGSPPQTETHLTGHHGPQAEDGPGPQRARPLLHVWGQHALRDQGVQRKSYCVKALMKLLLPGLRRHHWQHHG